MKRNVLPLINHNAYNPYRALRGLQDSTESPVCQEIQEKQDPQATLPTLGWVNKSLSNLIIKGLKVDNCLKMSFQSFQGNLVSQMASGFNEKSSFAGMVSGSRVSVAKKTLNFKLHVCKVVKFAIMHNLKTSVCDWFCFRVNQEHEDFQGCPDKQ